MCHSKRCPRQRCSQPARRSAITGVMGLIHLRKMTQQGHLNSMFNRSTHYFLVQKFVAHNRKRNCSKRRLLRNVRNAKSCNRGRALNEKIESGYRRFFESRAGFQSVGTPEQLKMSAFILIEGSPRRPRGCTSVRCSSGVQPISTHLHSSSHVMAASLCNFSMRQDYKEQPFLAGRYISSLPMTPRWLGCLM